MADRMCGTLFTHIVINFTYKLCQKCYTSSLNCTQPDYSARYTSCIHDLTGFQYFQKSAPLSRQGMRHATCLPHYYD